MRSLGNLSSPCVLRQHDLLNNILGGLQYMVLLKLLFGRLLSLMLRILWLFPVRKNKLLFCSFAGGVFRDNPKYICKELAKRGEGYELYWTVRKGIDTSSFPDYIKPVTKWSPQYFYHLATARIWVDDNRKSSFVCRHGRVL